ncbi:DUF3331 domain-containing protein [Burkholderia ubonensis]|uniref:DUF3331 domain-containing protein n=1 Tax=Burkholderia ubonensis TaxID=101571 RepID=UPI0009B42B34|nr:DUF3331 domain-containing protein [Burkholderia ubonensis]
MNKVSAYARQRISALFIPLMAMDPWKQTLSLLLQLCRSNDARSFASSSEPLRAHRTEHRSRLRTTGAERRTASVSFVDRASATAVTIAWRDSTHCSYGDQAWHATRARTSGVCAISGRPVRIGDAFYQPRGRPRPLNAGAMILASTLHEAEENR